MEREPAGFAAGLAAEVAERVVAWVVASSVAEAVVAEAVVIMETGMTEEALMDRSPAPPEIHHRAGAEWTGRSLRQPPGPR